MTWKLFGDIAFYVCTGVTVLFALMYLIFAPWWKTMGGRNIMAVMGSVALMFGYFAWAIARGGIPPALHPIRAFLFSAIALSIGWRVLILIRHHILRSLRTSKKGNHHDLEDAR